MAEFLKTEAITDKKYNVTKTIDKTIKYSSKKHTNRQAEKTIK